MLAKEHLKLKEKREIKKNGIELGRAMQASAKEN